MSNECLYTFHARVIYDLNKISTVDGMHFVRILVTRLKFNHCHYLANMLDHRDLGKVLSDAERSQAYDHLKCVNEDNCAFCDDIAVCRQW